MLLIFHRYGNISLLLFVFSQQNDIEPGGDQPIPPPSKNSKKSPHKKKMPKRKKRFTRVLGKKVKTVAAPGSSSEEADVSNLIDSPASARVRRVVFTQGAKDKVSKSLLESKLKSLHKKLDSAQSTLADHSKTIDSLSKKNQQLTAAVKSGRETIRQTKTLATDTVKDVKGRMKETQAAASTTIKLAKSEVKKSQATTQALQAAAAERDSLIISLKKQHEIELAARESAAIEKERVSV